ncbi:hypothetical protein CTI12_AA207230 [Artemisia annua]|uniref:CTLH domain-containing protein n=1 Tax=Artemisia annua TaxID=35608 RepID=A0A2U1NY97_ARTAN|nr:hypothetical protein CTI12_AA207230 [Artemisia annua]
MANARAMVAGAGAMLRPVSSITQVVMKGAQNVAQAVVRTRSTLSAWSCMGARRRPEDFSETPLILEKHADYLTSDKWSIEQATINNLNVFFEIQKQKFLEALDRNDHPKACQILHKDLKVFSGFNQELYKEVTTFGSRELQHVFRENEQLSKYADAKTARSVMLAELKKLIEANPLFRDKLRYPSFKSQRLRTLINQRLQLLLGEMICVIKLSKLEF